MLKLYGYPISGNTHKIRLMLKELGLEYEEIEVDLLAGEHKQAEFLKINPFGQVPALTDGDNTIYDSHAILVYLARKHNRTDLLPEDALAMAEVQHWLAFSANEIQNGPFLARLHYLLSLPMDIEAVTEKSHIALKQIDDHLTGKEWLVANQLSIADFACFPYIALVHEGKIELTNYKNITGWIERIKALPNFVSMPGI